MLKKLLPYCLVAMTLNAPTALAQTLDEATSETPRRIPFNLSLIGPYGFAQVFDEPVVAHGNFNLLGGHIYGLDGVGIGTLYNHVDHTLSGFQAAAGLNIVGRRTVGFQAAGLGNFSLGSLNGVQAAGGLNVAGTVEGAQFAGLYNLSTQRVTGLQAAVINQANVVDPGIQAAVFNLAGTIKGLQTAVVNGAGEVNGAQIGVLNVGGTVKGVQIGVLNIADDVQGVPIGLFSYVRQGRLEGDIQVTDSGLTTLGVNSGTQRVYSILGVSNLPKADGNHLGLNLGLGVQFPLSATTFSRLEITGGPVQENPSSAANWTPVNSYKGMLGWKIAPRLAVKAGLSLNYAHLREGSSFRPSENAIAESGRHQIWPAAFIGFDL
jgi:hypothetical protein